MQPIYDFLNSTGFEFLQYDFMKNALLAVLLMSPLFGLMGTIVVNNRLAFFSDSIGHSALTGIALGLIAGMTSPVWSLIVFAVFYAVLLVLVKTKSLSSVDTTIGVFSSIALALSIAIFSTMGGINKYTSYLIGSLLSVTPSDLTMLLVILVIVLVYWFGYLKNVFIVGFNTDIAKSRGIDPIITEMTFTILLAVVVALSIQWVGILLINSLLILPAATARNIAKGLKQYTWYSIFLALFGGLIGLISSYYFETATGATIVLTLGIFYCLSFILRKLIN